MKKLKVINLILLLILVILAIIFCLIFFRYAFWQKVTIPSLGSFKVPKDWIVTKNENIIYITDKPIEEDYKIYLVGVGRVKGADGKYHYDFFENAETLGSERGAVYSNSAGYWVEKFNINGVIKEKYVIYLYYGFGHPLIYLIAWDNLIDENTIIKITKSYIKNDF